MKTVSLTSTAASSISFWGLHVEKEIENLETEV